MVLVRIQVGVFNMIQIIKDTWFENKWFIFNYKNRDGNYFLTKKLKYQRLETTDYNAKKEKSIIYFNSLREAISILKKVHPKIEQSEYSINKRDNNGQKY
jgi:hypothetical protein